MKELKKKLLNLAMLHLTEDEFKRIETYVKMDYITSLRIYLSDLSELYEVKGLLGSNKNNEWFAMDELNNLALEIAIQSEDGNVNDGIVKSRRRRRIPSTGSEIIV
jgi:hypothetical protein